jgi:putative endonuclease
MREYYVYILTNLNDTVLYTGVTNNLYLRVLDHRAGKGGRFTARYQVKKLVYYEVFEWSQDAIAREKQIKGGSRQKKVDLVNDMNPDWQDLFESLIF